MEIPMEGEALDGDGGFRAEVARGMAEADDPTIDRIPNEVVQASWRVRRSELVEQLRKRNG